MSIFDWIVLFGTLIFVVLFGLWKKQKHTDMEGFLKGNSTPWWIVGLSIMATQASAITFLSTTGQGMEDGLRFVQFYFGMPLAMIIIAYKFAPLYFKFKVYTAYEFLESRFDAKTRTLTAFLFLVIRGMSAGITLYAPSLVLSTILGWNITFTTFLISLLVLVYVIVGGVSVVSKTQSLQLTIVMSGMLLAGVIAWLKLPDFSFNEAFTLSKQMGKMNAIVTDFSWSDRYNIWSGVFASTFLFLSYFGTDHSQVMRYLGGKSVRQIRMGLLVNGALKIPMQFTILFIGVIVFLFYQFNYQPSFHNDRLYKQAINMGDERLLDLEKKFQVVQQEKLRIAKQWTAALKDEDTSLKYKKQWEAADVHQKTIKNNIQNRVSEVIPGANTNDRDYMFLNFVLNHLPHGIIGLLIAVVFLAAMSSLSAELNALSSVSTMDIYRRWIAPNKKNSTYVKASKGFTLAWVFFALLFAFIVGKQQENLIQFVNIVGSLFYGTILGIFLCAFYIKYIQSKSVFIAAILGELSVLSCFFWFRNEIGFLYYNIIGCVVVIGVGLFLQYIFNRRI